MNFEFQSPKLMIPIRLENNYNYTYFAVHVFLYRYLFRNIVVVCLVFVDEINFTQKNDKW